MSILQEYELIRKEIGETTFQHIKQFLLEYPNLFLSDVYYKKSVWDQFEEWEKLIYQEGKY